MKQCYSRIALMALLLVGYFSVDAQTIWADVPPTSFTVNQDMRKIIPNKYRTLAVSVLSLQSILQSAPLEGTAAAQNSAVILSIPMPDGSLNRFRIVRTKIMEDGLAARFPGIRTYGGQGIDDPYATIKMDWTEYGFHAMILSQVNGSVFVDPYALGDVMHYISYDKKDLSPKYPLIENDVIVPAGRMKSSYQQRTQTTIRCVAQNIRTYRLAIACTGEYARAATGLTSPTKAQVLSAIVTTINRVDGVYETETDLKMVLVANETDVIYTTPGTGFTTAANNNAGQLLSASQTVIDNGIGNANYDMGHTFSTGGGGVSLLGVICQAGSKASSITGSPTPTGDGYDIDYVAHEMGHSLGGQHTFNNNTLGSCGGNASGSANAEPGSGITIMAYAGICGSQDLAAHSIAYFHPISFEEITAYTIDDAGATCGVLTPSGNNPPVVNAGSDYTIPKSTPFILTGSATDPDNDALTYSWDQVDVGGPFGNWNAPVGDAPIFRPFSPVTVPYRYFPKLSNVIGNSTTIGEILPTYARTMHFRLTARDNKMGGGGVCGDEAAIAVDAASGPFLVTSPNTAITWTAGHCESITWDVANTGVAPVSCANVSIELSTDGGNTFPIVLISSTPNDGAAQAIIPNNITTSQARVRVKSIGNVFYDMSNANFNIVQSTQAEYAMCSPDAAAACANTPANVIISTNAINGFATPITFSATGNPAGSTVTFSPNPVTPGSDVTLTMQGTFAVGTYTLDVQGTANAVIRNVTVILNAVAGTTSPVQTLPADNALGVVLTPSFTWQGQANATSYTLEVSDNAAFTAGSILTYTTSSASFTLPAALLMDTEYWWRVTANNACGGGPISSVFHFKTGLNVCDPVILTSTNVPVLIATTPVTVNSTLNVNTPGAITDVDVVGLQGVHTYISDLTVSLKSPANTIVKLFDQVCGDKQDFDINFDDQATSSVIPCPPTGGVTRIPAQPLATFNNELSAGMWTLIVKDSYNQDGGSLNGWGLRFCTLQPTAFPVNWLTFTGNKNENKTVTLNWSTANELNNGHYEIEKSSDGIHFLMFGKINAGNHPDMVQHYYYTDMKPYTGVNYYRLKQVDKDGKYNYSKIVRVLIDKAAADFAVYPNPATDKSTVRVLSEVSQLTIRLTDALGKVVYQRNAGAAKAGQEINIPLKGFGKGVYSLSFITDNNITTEKLVVK